MKFTSIQGIRGLFVAVALLGTLVAPAIVRGGDREAWLQYAPVFGNKPDGISRLPAFIVSLDDSDVVRAARSELIRGLRGMLGRTLRAAEQLENENAIVLGTFQAIRTSIPAVSHFPELPDEGFWLRSIEIEGRNYLLVAAPDPRGVLYGTMCLLRRISLGDPLTALNDKQSPAMRWRIVGHEDGLDGSVKEGYSGRSIFWEGGQALGDPGLLRDYGRKLASLGINGCIINRSSDEDPTLDSKTLSEAASIAGALRPWGLRVYLAVSLSSPVSFGRATNIDPFNADVIRFWRQAADDAYGEIPDLGGFVVVPTSDDVATLTRLRRSHAEAANAIAAPLQRHGGQLLYAAQDNQFQSWHGASPNAAAKTYRELLELDGEFAENVILQSNYGLFGGYAREPLSPLFGGLRSTSQAMLVSMTQRYTGQQRHVCYLAPAWKAALETELRIGKTSAPLKEHLAGRLAARPYGGMIAMTGIGRDAGGYNHPLAPANLYAFGRMAWNPNLTSRQIAEEWVRLTYGHDPLVVGTVADILMRSRRTYENYTGPLGLGPATDVDGIAYGPQVERSSTGTSDWRFADAIGIGHDRTSATGSGFTGHYLPSLALQHESIDTCPEEVLLCMHHVPYTYPLKSGKTVVQQLYDSLYQGARDAGRAADKWRRLRGTIDDARHVDVQSRLDYQAGHAQVWRDALCNWLARTSGMEDAENRVGNHSRRVEAEEMELAGYEVQEASPWESASGGKYVACTAADGVGSVRWKFRKKSGWMHIDVYYFDESDGVSHFQLLVGDQIVDEWSADLSLPDNIPNGHTATRHRTAGVALRSGDELRIEAIADNGEQACIDYVEVLPAE